jgi:phosphoglycerate dehydrogenase-like enzyme
MKLPGILTILVINRIDAGTVRKIESVSPSRVKVFPVWDDFQPELSQEWPDETMKRRGGGDSPPTRTREELEELIRQAHVAIVGVPWPIRVADRMPNLIWAHLPGAGVSNLRESAWWGGPAILTSARGSSAAIPIAESAMAGAFLLSRRLDIAVRQTDAHALDASAYTGNMRVLHGKTIGIVGLGGIGREVARIARGAGMRVIATRRSVTERRLDTDGVDVVLPPSETLDLLAESDFIAVCAMWTPETERLIDARAFAATKRGAFLLNVARGEIVDELAMVDALKTGQLAGAYIDVWWDDTQRPPIPEVLDAPNLVITPHVSGGSDGNFAYGMDIFCENLKRLLNGDDLLNVVDWTRGY